MKKILPILCFIFSVSIFSQSILVYHETNGFRHTGAINAGITMFNNIGTSNGFTVVDSQNSNVFTASNLAQYDLVVFLNTSGNSNNFNADMEVKASHPTIDFLGPIGTIWNKNEEYYYWQNNGGQLSTDNTVLLEVEQTGNNSYDAARPITWYKESITYNDDNNNSTPDITLNGVRSFYTALGHNGSDYSGNSNFINMLENATLWAIGNTLSLEEETISEFKIVPNPVKSQTNIYFKSINEEIELKLYDILGKEVFVKTINQSSLSNNVFNLDMSEFKNGIYLLKLSAKSFQKSYKVVKI